MDKFNDGFRFRTEISTPSECLHLDHTKTFFTIGSCFADHIGAILKTNKFPVTVNPFGTVYDPVSIHRLLKYVIDHTSPDPSDFVERDGIYFCDELHSSVNASSPELLQKKISELISAIRSQFTASDIFLITFGTAWVYVRKDRGKQVANCHKLPGTLFSKQLLQPEQVINSFKDIYALIRKSNPAAQFILTVSPVRHIKDSLELNAVSKSVIRLSAHQLSELPGVFYYPAFEMMNDDLRDYRYYSADLIHPNEQAIEYIWEHLKYFLFGPDTRNLIERYEKIRRSLSHRPFNEHSSAHQAFLNNLIKEMTELNDQLDLSKEIAEIRSRLSQL